MANQYPDYVPTGFQGNYRDFLHAKVDRDGCLRNENVSISIPDNSTAGTSFGLVPFNDGFRLSYGATRLYVTDLDTATNVTFDIGYLYESTALTSDDDAFASDVTTGQAAGFFTFDEEEGLVWTAEGNGWIVATLSAGPVTTAGTLTGQAAGCYDVS